MQRWHSLRINIFILLLAVMSLAGYTQSKTDSPGKPLTISIFNEATALPFTRLATSPLHPGIMVGTAFPYSNKTHHHFFQSLNVGYFYHRHLMQAVLIHSDLGYQYRFGFGLSAGVNAGLGYLHAFKTVSEYRLIDGQYRQATDQGSSKAVALVGVDVGMYIRPADIRSPRLFVSYQGWVEYPFSPGFIPLMSHTNLHLGITFYPFSKY